MYKLLLVDDEEEVRKGILNKIEWNKWGFEVVGEAENGKEALEMVEKNVPDVIITDIKMPFMDGLELAKVVRERFPTTRIVILTGFDEFKFAQQAIKLNIVEYVLKPVSSTDIIEVLQKVKAGIDEEIARREDLNALRQHYIRSLPVLRDKLLTTLITRKLERSEIQEKFDSYGIKLSGSIFMVSVVSVDHGAANAGACTIEDEELLKFAISNISEEIMNKYLSGVVLIHNDHVVLIAGHDTDDEDKAVEHMFLVLEEIRQSLAKFLELSVTIGLGAACDDISCISHSYEGAVTALDYRMVMGSGRIIYINDIEPMSTEKVVFDDQKERMLSTYIRVGTVEEINEYLDFLFKELVEVKASLKDCQIYLIEMIASIVKVCKSLQVDIAEIFGENVNLFVDMYNFSTIDEVKNWIKGICVKLMGYISGKRRDLCDLQVEMAKEYAMKNYSNPEITIEKVCRYLHISPSYFSSIFKKKTGETFMSFLQRIRMETAKELLKTTNLKAFEIAEKVGYSDPHYFSFSYKKFYGLSPKEYRSNLNSQ